MLKRDEGKQLKMTFLTLEDLMPEKHFLRDLERCVDFSFIYDIVEPLYARIGRSSVDPVLLVKMLLLGYLYGIPSERKLEQEVRVNIAFRWFLGIDFDEPVPDHSTISQLRRRKFGGTTLFQDIFDEVVRKCMTAGLVTGKLLLTDSTHILANAAKEKREVIEVPDTPSEYVKKLDREALEAGLLDEPVTYPEKTRTVTKSTTDPESGLMNRPGKPNAFCYLDHQTSDAESGIITDVFVTPGNVNDCTPHTSRLETQIDKFGFETEAVCADAGYDNSEVYDAMLKRGIRTYIPKKRKPNSTPSYTEGFEPEAFTYDSEEDVYICPQGKILAYSCYNKKGQKKRYLAAKKDCSNCPCRQQCIGSSKNSRMVERMLHEEARQEQAKNRNTPEYFAALRLRKIWCEGNFSHQKAEHNLRRTYKRGIERVTEQCLLSACAMNLIRLVKAANAVFFHCLGAIFQGLFRLGVFVNSAETRHPFCTGIVKCHQARGCGGKSGRECRYADDFLIGFTGSKADAEEIKAAMHNFLKNELHLELSQEKTLITNASSQAAKFLGYEIKAQRVNDYIDPKGRRGANGAIALLVPAKVIESKCQSFKRNGKVTHRNALLQDDDFSIVQQFQAEYHGLVQYYIMAQNLSWFSMTHCRLVRIGVLR